VVLTLALGVIAAIATWPGDWRIGTGIAVLTAVVFVLDLRYASDEERRNARLDRDLDERERAVEARKQLITDARSLAADLMEAKNKFSDRLSRSVDIGPQDVEPTIALLREWHNLYSDDLSPRLLKIRAKFLRHNMTDEWLDRSVSIYVNSSEIGFVAQSLMVLSERLGGGE